MKIFKAEPSHWYLSCDAETGYFENLFKLRRDKPGFNRRMFDEDFSRLFHSSRRSSDNLFDIVSNDDEIVQMLLRNVKTNHSLQSVGQKIRELTEEIAQSLISFGKAYYFLHDEPNKEEVHIVSFSSDAIWSLFGTYFQWVPRRTERHWDRDNEQLQSEIRILDPQKVMRFELPRSIKSMLSAQNTTFSVIDDNIFDTSNFYSPPTHETPNPTIHFNFNVWSEMQERALYRSTRNTGWSCRKYDSSKRSDFFTSHRLIRFRRNQLLLRDDILSQLGAELTRVGKRYKARFSVHISGTGELATIRDLNELEQRLILEEVGFKEIIDYCFAR